MRGETSNLHAKKRWNERAVGSQRSSATKGSKVYFEDIRSYRFSYETPFLPRLLHQNVVGKEILEIGVGHGIDAIEMVRGGAKYTGLDITENHIELTKKNFALNQLPYEEIINGDLQTVPVKKKYDIVYSFGVLHHIAHEDAYLKTIRKIIKEDGELRIAVYSKHSFFNYYMYFTWLVKNRCKVAFNTWQGYVSDGASFDYPITIKVRSKKEILKLYTASGFKVKNYYKRGFVRKYIPLLGRFLRPDGRALNFLGSVLGWYHIFIFEPSS
ncbi:MAG: class I SAM-dependent methyltransferase [Maribacter sp.]|uniref:class I SAM-dependent methyltransferase n=1 Tax=Maribacter sp. TaxID=1897614 RepID=UPI003297CF3C